MDNSIYNLLQYFVTHSIKKSTFKHEAAISDEDFFYAITMRNTGNTKKKTSINQVQ